VNLDAEDIEAVAARIVELLAYPTAESARSR
jgi:hypothetical protein